MIETTNASKASWMRKSLWILTLLALFVLWWVVPTVNQARLDAQVRELCAKDGGVKVYEMVMLPTERFDKYGDVTFPNSVPKEPYGPDYRLETSSQQLLVGSPNIYRLEQRVVRLVDSRILGISIEYSRVGGDPIGPWHDSSYGCPGRSGWGLLSRHVFIKNTDQSKGLTQ